MSFTMKHLCKSSDKSVVELSEDITFDILNCLPSKSLARFVCVCKHWRKCIADPSLDYSCRSKRWSLRPYMMGFFYQGRNPLIFRASHIRFFRLSENSSQLIDDSIDESINFLDRGWYIIASSNGFVLITEDILNQRVYCVYNPATRQYFDVPPNQKSCMKVAAVGFHCKIDNDPEKDVITFSIVRCAILVPLHYRGTIESFSSETNVWTSSHLVLDVPPKDLCSWKQFSSAVVIDGVFCWIAGESRIILYDSVNIRISNLELPEEMQGGSTCALGVSDGVLYYALCNDEGELTVWCLEGNIRNQEDAGWIEKYFTDLADPLQPLIYKICGDSISVLNVEFHPDNPHIFYLLVGDKFFLFDSEINDAELLYDIGEPLPTENLYYSFFRYEWHQWPRLLKTHQLAESKLI